MTSTRARRLRGAPPISDADYAGFFFSEVSRDELALFAVHICRKVSDYRITLGYEGSLKPPLTSEITNRHLLKTLEQLDRAIFRNKQSKNAHVGEIKLGPAWEQVKRLHEKHRATCRSRAEFVRLVEKQMATANGCPATRTLYTWVADMDKQPAG